MAEENVRRESEKPSREEPPEKMNFELAEKELNELSNLLDQIDRSYKRVSIKAVTIDREEYPAELVIELDNPRNEHTENLKLRYNCKPISAKDAVKERRYLQQEYDYEHGVGQHWDNLRWNVSKFFVGIQTVFVVAALKGLLELSDGNVDNMPLLIWGLIVLAVFNVAVCVIWCVRNLGIHSWHRAAIKRQRLIELDPRWKHIPWFNLGVVNIMRNREGLIGTIHGTGDLECYGPPAAFCLLWIGVVILAISF